MRRRAGGESGRISQTPLCTINPCLTRTGSYAVAHKLRFCPPVVVYGRRSSDLVASVVAAKERKDDARHASFLRQTKIRSRVRHSPETITASAVKHRQASAATHATVVSMALLVISTTYGVCGKKTTAPPDRPTFPWHVSKRHMENPEFGDVDGVPVDFWPCAECQQGENAHGLRLNQGGGHQTGAPSYSQCRTYVVHIRAACCG